MTSTAAPLSTEWPTTVFHANGVKDQVVQNRDEYDRAMKEGWFSSPQEPPPPPPPPMTPEESLAMAQSELEGLGDQVDAQGQTILSVEERLTGLSESHQSTGTVITGLMSMMQEMQTRQTQLEGRQKQQQELVTTMAETVHYLQSKPQKLETAIDSLRQKDIALDEALSNAGATFAQIDGRLTALESKKKGAQ